MYSVQNLMNTVNKRKLLKLYKFISIVIYYVKNPPQYLFFPLLYLVCFHFFNRSVTKCFVITNYLFSLSLSSFFNQNSLVLCYVCMLCLFLLIWHVYICWVKRINCNTTVSIMLFIRRIHILIFGVRNCLPLHEYI